MRDRIEIRYATKNDCEALSKIIAMVIQNIPYYNDLAKQNEIAKFHPDDLLEKINLDKYSVIISTVNNDIIGFCLSRFDDYTIWLEWFGILETQRGKGIGHLLLNEVDKTISLRQCTKIWCDCRTSNQTSIHMLQSHGYKQLVTVLNHWYGQDFILWEKCT